MESVAPPRFSLRPSPAEAVSCYSHLAGAVAGLVGTAALVAVARDGAVAISALVYGLSLVFMFTASALYHAQKVEEGGQSVWRRLDHLAIFFMIAGSYTPICWVHLDGAWRVSFLAVQWGLVVFGVVFKLFVLNAPRWVTVGIYLVMGWLAVIPLHRIVASMDGVSTTLLVAGGVTYTLGALTYATKWPDPRPGRFGFHELWHCWVLAAAALHYGAIYRTVS